MKKKIQPSAQNLVSRVIFPSDTSATQPVVRLTDISRWQKPTSDDPEFYQSDDDDGDFNRIGNIPLHWYDDEDHVGYNLTQQKLLKRQGANDEVQKFLESFKDSENWRNIIDQKNQTMHTISDHDLGIIQRIVHGRFPSASFNMTDPFESVVEFDNPEEALFPTTNRTPSKRAFGPSFFEKQRVRHLVQQFRKNRIRLDSHKQEEPDIPDIWGDRIFPATVDTKSGVPTLSAPKMPPPTSFESYNPPEDCLYNEQEEKEWLEACPENRVLTHLPKKYSSLRQIPLYESLILEQFQRCLDLYLCPRSVRMRMNIDPSSLLASLPSLKDLKPFPTRLSVTYTPDSEKSAPMSLSFDATGTYLAVGRKNGVLDIFETDTSRLMCTLNFKEYCGEGKAITSVQFNPAYPILAIGSANHLFIIIITNFLPALLDPQSKAPAKWSIPQALTILKQAKNLLTVGHKPKDSNTGWQYIESEHWQGWHIEHPATITQCSWHRRGYYLLCVSSKAVSPSHQLILHAVKQTRSLRPLYSSPFGKVQAATFHPTKNHLFVAATKGVRIYDLQSTPKNLQSTSKNPQQKQSLLKKFTGVDQVTCMSVHRTGELVVVGGLNRRLTWFDCELGEKPLKIMRSHTDAVSSVSFHSSYPLAYSATRSGDASLFSIDVPKEIWASPKLIPIKTIEVASQLNENKKSGMNAIYSMTWHPSQPWFAAGLSSGNVGLFV